MMVVDAALVNLTERFCHAFQRLTGRTNVWFAFQLTNLSIVIYFVWVGLYFWSFQGLTRAFVAIVCGVLLWALSQTVLRVPLETYESSAFRRVASGARNPRRVRDALLRIPFLTLSLMLPVPAGFIYQRTGSALVLLGYSLVVLTTTILYLLACDPLPPQRGLLAGWLSLWRPASPGRSEALAED